MSKYKYHLEDVEWGEFKIKNLFEVTSTVTTHPSKLKPNGKTPRITCAATNNGLDNTYDNKSTEKGGVLTVDSATVGYIAYQPFDFIATDHVEKISLKHNIPINRNIGLFLKTTITSSTSSKYGYGYKFSQKRIREQIIKLPIDQKGNPNWSFMENYIKEREIEKKKQLIEYYKYKLVENVLSTGGDILNDVEWKEFFVSDIFDVIKRGKRLTKANQIDGKMPYVSSTALNNGVDNFIGNTEDVRKSNDNITISNSGSVGACFFHDYEYVASDHVTSLTLSNANKQIYKFMSVILGRLEEKYSFNREINDTRIKREKILLPIDQNGNPNWLYMENFIKNIEQKKLAEVVEYLKQYIYIYKQGV